MRTQIYAKDKDLLTIGPLNDGAVVSKEILATLIRLTSINAHRYILQKANRYVRPLKFRRNFIKKVVEKFTHISTETDVNIDFLEQV